MYSETDLHLTFDDDECLVGVIVPVPNEITLELDKLELNVVEFCNDFGRPMFGKETEFFSEIYGGHLFYFGAK